MEAILLSMHSDLCHTGTVEAFKSRLKTYLFSLVMIWQFFYDGIFYVTLYISFYCLLFVFYLHHCIVLLKKVCCDFKSTLTKVEFDLNKICREDVSNSSFVSFQIWDFPGQIDFFDPTFDYEMIFRGTGALIFVIDSQVTTWKRWCPC